MAWESATPRVSTAYGDFGGGEAARGGGARQDEAADAGSEGAVDDGTDGPAPGDVDDQSYEEEQRRLDREWYDESAERELPEVGPPPSASGGGGGGGTQQKRVSLRQLQYNRDNEAWETNRMLLSGVVQRTSGNVDNETEEEVRLRS